MTENPNQTPLPIGGADKEPEIEVVDLPSGWRSERLETVVDITRKPRGLKISDFDLVPFIPMEFVPSDGSYEARSIPKEGNSISSGTYCEARDILLAKITPSLENGKQGLVSDELPDGFAMATTEVYPLKPKPEAVDRGFLFFFLLYAPVRNLLASRMEGSTGRQRLPRRVLNELALPVPPLEEQRAIASVLDAVQGAREAAEKVIASARELKRSMMDHLFTYGPVPVSEVDQVPTKDTEAGTIPDHWEVRSIGKLLDHGPQNGLYKAATHYGSGTKILRIDAFGIGDTIQKQSLKRLNLTNEELAKFGLQKDDLVINRVNGNIELVGKCAIVGDIEEPVVFESNMMRMSVRSDVADARYMLSFLSSVKARDEIRKKARLVNQASINQQDIKSLSITLPTLDEQQRIVEALGAVDEKIASEEARRDSLTVLFGSLLDELMTGRLRVGEFSVEPDELRGV